MWTKTFPLCVFFATCPKSAINVHILQNEIHYSQHRSAQSSPWVNTKKHWARPWLYFCCLELCVVLHEGLCNYWRGRGFLAHNVAERRGSCLLFRGVGLLLRLLTRTAWSLDYPILKSSPVYCFMERASGTMLFQDRTEINMGDLTLIAPQCTLNIWQARLGQWSIQTQWSFQIGKCIR